MKQQVNKIKIKKNSNDDLTLEIVRILCLKQAELLFWETYDPDIYLKFSCKHAGDGNSTINVIEKLPGVQKVERIENMPDKKHQEKDTFNILDYIDFPLLVINNEQVIEICNSFAVETLKLHQYPTGKPIQSLFEENVLYLVEKSLLNNSKVSQVVQLNANDKESNYRVLVSPTNPSNSEKKLIISFIKEKANDHKEELLRDHEKSQQNEEPPQKVSNVLKGAAGNRNNYSYYNKNIVSRAQQTNEQKEDHKEENIVNKKTTTISHNYCKHCGYILKFGAVSCVNCFAG